LIGKIRRVPVGLPEPFHFLTVSWWRNAPEVGSLDAWVGRHHGTGTGVAPAASSAATGQRRGTSRHETEEKSFRIHRLFFRYDRM